MNTRSILAAFLVPFLAPAAVVTSRASATILRPAQVGPRADMDFGHILLLGDGGGQVTLSCTGEAVHTGNLREHLNPAHAPRSPLIEVSSTARRRYRIRMRETFRLRRQGGRETMEVRFNKVKFGNAVHAPADFPNGVNQLAHPSQTGVTQHNGKDIFSLGAVLKVGARQPAGRYAGTFSVTIEFE